MKTHLAGQGRDAKSTELLTSSFTTRSQAAFHRGARKRMLWAVVLGICALVTVLLLAPDPDLLIERLEDYGAPGDMRIMPEISIEDGQDQAHQLPKSLQTPPPPAKMEIEKEETSETGTEPVPREREESDVLVDTEARVTDPNSDLAQEDQVEFHLPMQSNPDLYLLYQVRPQYPLTVPESELQVPVIIVQVAIFVNPDGDVTEAMIRANTGSRIFAEEVLEKVRLWKFGWRVPPGAGRWIKIPFNFKSPYFTRTGQQR